MSENTMMVDENMVVQLAYVLWLESGEEIDRAENESPLEYLHGFSQIIPGLEKELLGMSVGDSKELVVAPADGYGEYKMDEVVEIPREHFPIHVKAEIGKPLSIKDHQSGQSFRAYVKDVSPEAVVLDFNHPLAGKELYFNVEIVGLRKASLEEIQQGFVSDTTGET